MDPFKIKQTVRDTFLANKKQQLAEEQAFLKARMDEANRSDADDPQDRASETSDELYRRIENHKASLDALQEEIELLEQQDIHDPEELVSLGALVETNHGWYYVAASHPPLTVEGVKVVGVSQHSPWYQAARTLPVGQHFTLNDQQHTVKALY